MGFFKKGTPTLDDLARELVGCKRSIKVLEGELEQAQKTADALEIEGGEAKAVQDARAAVEELQRKIGLYTRRAAELEKELRAGTMAELTAKYEALSDKKAKLKAEKEVYARLIGVAIAQIEHFSSAFKTFEQDWQVSFKKSPYGYTIESSPWLPEIKKAMAKERDRLKEAEPEPLSYFSRWQREVAEIQDAFQISRKNHLVQKMIIRACRRIEKGGGHEAKDGRS